jgi:nitrogen-specific signal transduction histidine kinase/CheY-like chemotaxis protein/HPt (histidine-containing phosphotransfer) domain-containing protein
VLFLFFRDLRKSRIYQSALREAKKQAENLTRTKALFVATVSHEMRTPLNAIQGLSEQLLQKNHEQQTKKDLQVIYESTRHLTELVNDTFDYTRIENKGLELKPSHFLLNDLLDKLEFYHKKGAAHKNISFKLKKHFDHNLVLLGDEGRFKQILNNLLSNAIKFTDAGQVELKVIAEKAEKIQLIKFEISDTGIGIAKESQQLIFDDFIQLETDLDKKAGGTGLGLYIVKKLVELLKGEIEVESTPGSGTVFRVKLPFQEGDAAQLENTVKSYPASSALSGQKSLLVDDDEFNRHLLKSLFGKWKLDFDEAQNGREALELATENMYSLILMDIRMPELNGIDAARLLKTLGNKAKIIALSANTADKINPEQEELFDACAEKPFSEEVLHQLIEAVFKNEKHPLEKPTSKTQELAPDLSELERMSKGNPQFMQEMIILFIESSEKSLNAIQDNLEKGNYNLVADFAHKLAAPVKYMNVLSVYQKIKAIQDMAENKPIAAELGSKISELKTEIAALHEELKLVLEKISE